MTLNDYWLKGDENKSGYCKPQDRKLEMVQLADTTLFSQLINFPRSPCAWSALAKNGSENPILWPSPRARTASPSPPGPLSAGRPGPAAQPPSVPLPGPGRARRAPNTTCVSMSRTHASPSRSMPTGKENGSQGASLSYENKWHMTFLL